MVFDDGVGGCGVLSGFLWFVGVHIWFGGGEMGNALM